MGTLTALLLATPVFGLALTPPATSLAPAQLQGGAVHVGGAQAGAAHAAPVAAFAPAMPAGLGVGLPPLATDADDPAGDEDMAAYAEKLRERADLVSIHKPLGIATWAAMGVTLLLGGIQYHNLYGSFADLGETPCDTGDAIFGQGQCSGTPWPHLISALTTTALYSATFAVSILMPDPDDAAEGDSEYAQNLRMHKLLRWVHFGGMIAQIALGAVVANAESLGLDRANDFGTLQALATVHMGLGFVTYGALTWAGALMVL